MRQEIQNKWLYEQVADAFVAVDMNGHIIECNDAYCTMLGYTADELKLLTYNDVTPQQWHAIEANVLKTEVIPHNKSTTYEKEYIRKDGTVFPIELKVCLIRSENGLPEYMTAIVRDISQRKQAEKELRTLSAYNRRLIEVSIDPLVTIGYDGKITDVNAATEVITGRMRDQLIGTDFSDYFTDKDKADKGYKRVYQEGTVRDYPLEIRHINGHTTPVLYNASVYYDEDGKVVGVFAAARDITESKHIEDQMREMNNKLFSYSSKLEEVNKDLAAFSYSVSHDLRAPLRAIAGFAKLLVEYSRDKLDSTAMDYVEKIHGAAKQMGALVDGVLMLSRLSGRTMEKTQIDMRSIVDDVIASLYIEIGDRKIDFVIDEIEGCSGDYVLLKQVWTNLIANAVKFTRAKDNPRIHIGGYRNENNEYVYFIKDNGIGFDESCKAKLFGIFERLNAPKEYEGTGVGLAIVHKIIARHGGKIWGESEQGNGAEFYFTL